MQKLNQILKTYVISYITKCNNGYLLAVIHKNDYGKDDSVQKHFDGDTLEKTIDNAYQNLLC